MKNIISFILAVLISLACIPAYGAGPGNIETAQGGSRTLVAYFSCTENTQGIAEHISSLLGAELYKIEPAQPYTPEDLNYNSSSSRANQEQNDANARPVISGSVTDMEKYDTVFLGYPIWWGQAPKIIYTFLESYHLSGKKVIPFCTSGSSGIGSSASNLHSLANGAEWLEGRRFSGGSPETEVKAWLDTLVLSAPEGTPVPEPEMTPGIQIENEQVTVNHAPENSTLILAFYNEGILTGVETKKGSGTITENIADKAAGANMFKAFLWDMQAIRPLCGAVELKRKEEETMRIKVASASYEIVYQLNQSQASKDLYRQLPLTLEVENYSNNEKIFYPPEALDTAGAPLADAGKGTLAYYSPWADVVMFYGDASQGSGLYELGEAVSGKEDIEKLSGTIVITAGD